MLIQYFRALILQTVIALGVKKAKTTNQPKLGSSTSVAREKDLLIGKPCKPALY